MTLVLVVAVVNTNNVAESRSHMSKQIKIQPRQQAPGIVSAIKKSTIPSVSIVKTTTQLKLKDYLGDWKARLGIGRMNYSISPGIYTVGSPTADSPVLVTANYKLTFNALRKELGQLDVWIMVIDTKGINVWCAAGKGTFGTDEIVNRIKMTQLHQLVNHKQIIVPQLGAPGIAAHLVKKETGFSVVYGPVRANDITYFLDNNQTALPSMRMVKFTTYDRLVLTPVELVNALKLTLIVLGILFILNQWVQNPFRGFDIVVYLGAIISGCVVTPLLLPVIPGPAFSWKGWLTGCAWYLLITYKTQWTGTLDFSFLRSISYFLLITGISAYYAMNFTGSSTYTSLSGVQKEMKIALPIIIISITLGCICIFIDSLIML